MTTELLLLLVIYAFVLLEVFTTLGGTFDRATPKLAARIERNITIGHKFKKNNAPKEWEKFE